VGSHDREPPESRAVDASLYDSDYFLQECEGYEEFVASAGRVLSHRLEAALAHVKTEPGMNVLDIGCGRGESLIWLLRQGAKAWGLDYAPEALRLTSEALQRAGLPVGQHYALLSANGRQLPFASESFDRALMLDIVEHLQPWELEQALAEAWRVLKQGGQLIVHTAPNLWYYQFGYPFFRLFQRLRGIQLPQNPRHRFRSHSNVHVNEQSPRSLRRVLRQAGFESQVWLEDLQQRWTGSGRLAYLLGWLVTHVYPLKWIFCGDVLAVATKVEQT